jgi:hypothetical protein
MAQLTYHKAKPYFSSLTKRSYVNYETAFQDSLRAGGEAELAHPSGKVEIVY